MADYDPQLIAITTSMSHYVPPVPPGEIYSQGFWHAVLAAILYFSGSVILTINMVGYFKGHYPQQFDLDDDQRTLILQTMMFFFWMAGGAGIFCAIEDWTFVNALYYADVVSIAPSRNPTPMILFTFTPEQWNEPLSSPLVSKILYYIAYSYIPIPNSMRCQHMYKLLSVSAPLS